MNAHSRFAWALGLSLIMWIPIALRIIDGSTEPWTGILYYLLALIIAWVGTGIVFWLINSYRETVDRTEAIKRQIESIEQRKQQDAANQQRRSTDDKPEES